MNNIIPIAFIKLLAKTKRENPLLYKKRKIVFKMLYEISSKNVTSEGAILK